MQSKSLALTQTMRSHKRHAGINGKYSKVNKNCINNGINRVANGMKSYGKQNAIIGGTSLGLVSAAVRSVKKGPLHNAVNNSSRVLSVNDKEAYLSI